MRRAASTSVGVACFLFYEYESTKERIDGEEKESKGKGIRLP